MSTFIRVTWIHDSADYPVLLLSEIDAARWERRKIELYRDGRVGFADKDRSTGTTRLAIEPMPPIEEIASYPEFEPEEISEAEFRDLWAMHVGQ